MRAEPTKARTALLAGADRRFGREVEARLIRDGFLVPRVDDVDAAAMAAAGGDLRLDAVILNALRPASATGFLDLPDAAFVSALEEYLELAAALQAALTRLREGGALVVLTSRGYLGGWGDAAEMAVSGATVATLRSIALEDAPRGVRANAVACDFAPGEFGADPRVRPGHAEHVAAAVAFLAGEDAAAVNGEVLLVNAGRSLQRREGRDRRADLPDPSSSTPKAVDR